MRIAIAADHAGYALKETIKLALAPGAAAARDPAAVARDFSPVLVVEDLGTNSDTSVDYPDFAAAVSLRVASGSCDRGILVCGTGIGMAMAANKFPGIRAATVWSPDTARLAREHNDANILALGARVLPGDLAVSLVRIFLETPFAGGRHQARVNKIDALASRPGA